MKCNIKKIHCIQQCSQIHLPWLSIHNHRLMQIFISSWHKRSISEFKNTLSLHESSSEVEYNVLAPNHLITDVDIVCNTLPCKLLSVSRPDGKLASVLWVFLICRVSKATRAGNCRSWAWISGLLFRIKVCKFVNLLICGGSVSVTPKSHLVVETNLQKTA